MLLHGSNGTETQTRPKNPRSSRKTQTLVVRMLHRLMGYCWFIMSTSLE